MTSAFQILPLLGKTSLIQHLVNRAVFPPAKVKWAMAHGHWYGRSLAAYQRYALSLTVYDCSLNTCHIAGREIKAGERRLGIGSRRFANRQRRDRVLAGSRRKRDAGGGASVSGFPSLTVADLRTLRTTGKSEYRQCLYRHKERGQEQHYEHARITRKQHETINLKAITNKRSALRLTWFSGGCDRIS
ncbi:MAG: hypothetical protein K0U74_05345 [Alphaproteobacteria bacterium]|nr:hypothetical protein [Alphaproteobacteria bacterium]